MKPIENVNLADVVAEAANEILDEKQKGVVSLIKGKLNELNQATVRISEMEKQLHKEREKAGKLQKWLEEVRAGNWAVLSLSEKQEQTQES